MFGHIGLWTTTTKISSFVICQRYWKMCHWLPQHECGACMMVLGHSVALLCEMFSVTAITAGG
jgi:hypothetical protein